MFRFGNYSGQKIKKHLTQRRQVTKTLRTSKTNNYRFTPKTFALFLGFPCVFASWRLCVKVFDSGFMVVELVINCAE
jgi:hypothetical protein